MTKIILPFEIADEIKPKLPSDISSVVVDRDGNFDGDGSDAEIYLNGFRLQPTTLHKVLDTAPKLRWQQTPSAGVNHILTPTFLQRDITLTNGAGIHAIPISEFVLAFILNHAKNLPQLHTFHHQHTWQKPLRAIELANSTILILGTGSIGRAIASRAKAFGMRVWGSRRHPEPLPNFDRIVGSNGLGSDGWYELLPGVDFLVVATPLTPETKGLIDTRVLRSLPPHAYLINIARGAIVDESALTTALNEGWIAGAALDTVATEPLPSQSPLWSLPNLLITPHTSALSPYSKERIIALFLDNLHRYQEGLPLINVVDKQAAY
ncbi:D-2-hydroxyacid dehydrogenase [Calothrix sp. 336/3]|uniref:D-2-hydroxyacid dehydrogenase n=1 Tax=Calothrix sp. 336/3 TaxID=1337936 RepID=UPI0004E3882F|nr:D-2-hydroxyacid dehydrogenase [Calothrix sp. 336/3]AKG21452.1 hydroxyacid dehydrogenase [Calothrix sp. 336/3]